MLSIRFVVFSTVTASVLSRPLDDFQENATCDNYRFYSNSTAPYLVKSMPFVGFPIGEMYSGLVPVSNDDTSRQLFFVFKPATESPVDEVTIWLNGGPGCSSLAGFIWENGPFLWQPGTYEPVVNPYSWARITNMLWVDQPVGTGFSIGGVRARSEHDVAADFISFFRNWQDLFGIKVVHGLNFRIYVSGESYAGRYVSYISAAMLAKNDKECFDLSGALLYDPTIGEYPKVQFNVPTYPFVKANNAILNLNATFLSDLALRHAHCGYADYTNHYLQFPPPGLQSPTITDLSADGLCDVQNLAVVAVSAVNPCFSIYNIAQQCPLLPNVLQSSVPGGGADSTTYFNRIDVKRALHAPLDVDWSLCSSKPVFVGQNVGGGYGLGPEFGNDTSPDPIQHVLPQVIEATNRVLISNGDWDMLFPTNGTLLAIQNMTWNGLLGFQKAPSRPIVINIPDSQNGVPQGTMGIQHFERGLLWAETFQAGHMQSESQPRVTFQHLRWLLGRVETL